MVRWVWCCAVAVSATACGEIREVPISDDGGGSTTVDPTSDGVPTESTSTSSSSTDGPEPMDRDTDPPETTGSTSGSTGEEEEEPSSFCNQDGADVPAEDPDGISSVLVVEDGRQILDLDVLVRLHHENPEGVTIRLRRGDAAPILLVEGSTVACSFPGGVAFDDESEDGAEGWCGVPGNPPIVNPIGALENFDDQPIGETWTLEVVDTSPGPGGGLGAWCLSAVLR